MPNDKRPVPTAEICATHQADGLGGSSIHITAVTPDAQAWVLAELPQYGELIIVNPPKYMLDVFQNYAGADVLAFILSYNEV
jgi:hypothetical protein